MKPVKMRILYLILMLTAALFIQQNRIFAETIEGKLLLVDPLGGNVSLEQNNPATGLSETFSISTSVETIYKGAGSMRDLSPGDYVRVNAQKNKISGQWEAKEVERNSKAGELEESAGRSVKLQPS